MNKIFQPIKERELRRFHQALDRETDLFLLENEVQPKVVQFIKNNFNLVDLLVDKLFELFEIQDSREKWDIFSAGIRYSCQKMPNSYFFRFVLPMFKLDDLGEKILGYSGQWLQETHLGQKALLEINQYLKNYAKGEKLCKRYSTSNPELVRLYASIKTWETKEKFDRFFQDFQKFLDTSLEVFISGPIQLYLMISRKSFLLIFKALTVEKVSTLSEDEEKYQEIMAFHDWIYSVIEKSETLRVFQKIWKKVVREFLRLLREEQENIRRQLPSRELKSRLIDRFEKGLLFQKEE